MSQEPERSKTIGAIFPVLPEHVSKLFDNRRVFVKFTKLKIETGSTIIFYVSGKKLLVGEAKVGRTQRLNPDFVWSRYGKMLFLDEEAYKDYVTISPISKERRRMRKVTVYELRDVKKYTKPIKTIYPITSSGRYLTKEMIANIDRLIEER